MGFTFDGPTFSVYISRDVDYIGLNFNGGQMPVQSTDRPTLGDMILRFGGPWLMWRKDPASTQFGAIYLSQGFEVWFAGTNGDHFTPDQPMIGVTVSALVDHGEYSWSPWRGFTKVDRFPVSLE